MLHYITRCYSSYNNLSIVVISCNIIAVTTLKEFRDKQYLSVAELAEKSGVPRNTIYGIESGQHKPIRRTIRALAKALGVKPEEIEF